MNESLVCVEKYLEKYRTDSPKYWKEAFEIEKLGVSLAKDFDKYSSNALEFVNRVEIWKAMGIQERILGVERNTDLQAQEAIKKAISSVTPKMQIESLHSLIGFGSSENKDYGRTQPAKVASAAMRFLFPDKWGVCRLEKRNSIFPSNKE
jgi:hypothetical protein